eukprot:2329460-Rhodomonas_salina.1
MEASRKGSVDSRKGSGSVEVCCTISLRVCYAISGTELACCAVSLRVYYVISGTAHGYLPTRVLCNVRY